MGCGASKAISIDDGLIQVSKRPAKGLPDLLNAIGKPDQQEEFDKKVPDILKMMPQALESLSVEDTKPIVAACDVIQQCLQKGGNQIASDDDSPKQCAGVLAAVLVKVHKQARREQIQNAQDSDASTKEAKAIANAFVALFKLDGHGEKCKAAFMSKGLNDACKLVEFDSGCKFECKQLVVTMLVVLVDKCSAAADLIVSQGTVTKLREIVELGKKNGIPIGVRLECCGLLEAVMQNATKTVEGADDIRVSIETCRSSAPASSPVSTDSR